MELIPRKLGNRGQVVRAHDVPFAIPHRAVGGPEVVAEHGAIECARVERVTRREDWLHVL